MPDNAARSELGQVLTPAPLARLMAGLVEAPGDAIALLDPGAGIGSLSASVIVALCERPLPPRSITVTACELDERLLPHLAATYAACAEVCAEAGVSFDYNVVGGDFLAFAATQLEPIFAQERASFDVAILNPPYRKIQTTSHERRLLSRLGIEVSNLYAGFVALALLLLRPEGELVAITPRSFCNGPYFRPFRELLLRRAALRSFHLFDTRQEAFRDDRVLQETVITTAVAGIAQQPTVTVASAHSPDDELPTVQSLAIDAVVHPNDRERIFHLVPNQLGELVAARVQGLPATLNELGLTVSTGRVVDFRAAQFLRAEPGADTVALLYPTHCEAGRISWPKAGKKPNALVLSEATRPLLIPNEPYVLVKRFSSKEERRRVVATLFTPECVPGDLVGFENHLNYFHCRGRGLELEVARGLVAFLNSTLVDVAFRQFNGHTQVNATDLRALRYPSRAQLIALDRRLASHSDQSTIDAALHEVIAMSETDDPASTQRRIGEAMSILKLLGLPRGQQNERSALTLLALLNLRADQAWHEAEAPLCGITPMMEFFRQHYGRTYAPNTRETVRRQSVHQFLEAGFIRANPDRPDRPVNSPKAVYQIEPTLLALLQSYASPAWTANLEAFLASIQTLQARYARERSERMLTVQVAEEPTIYLTPGGQNELIKLILEGFRPRFVPDGALLYVGDAGKKFAVFKRDELEELGVSLDAHGKMPDVILYDQKRRWLYLIEAVTSHGPIDGKRHDELRRLFASAKAGLIYVTAFLERKSLQKDLANISWETEVWIADAPSHLIHFDGERFLGPYGNPPSHV